MAGGVTLLCDRETTALPGLGYADFVICIMESYLDATLTNQKNPRLRSQNRMRCESDAIQRHSA